MLTMFTFDDPVYRQIVSGDHDRLLLAVYYFRKGYVYFDYDLRGTKAAYDKGCKGE